MNSIKHKIQNNIVSPMLEDQNYKISTGKIIKANEHTNLCDIQFIDPMGKIATMNNVQVVTDNVYIVDWFPKTNEVVIVMQYENQVFIAGPYINNYEMYIKTKQKLKNDIYPENASLNLSGYIL